MKIMAIDYGDAHTGIAISDPTGLLAGFTTVINSRRQEVVVEQVAALASIDVKKEERCLLEFSEKYRIPFQTYPAQKLQTVYGTFHGSDFVKSQVGVDNVCERAAMKAAGAYGRICRAKQAQNGMTVAIAEKAWKVSM